MGKRVNSKRLEKQEADQNRRLVVAAMWQAAGGILRRILDNNTARLDLLGDV